MLHLTPIPFDPDGAAEDPAAADPATPGAPRLDDPVPPRSAEAPPSHLRREHAGSLWPGFLPVLPRPDAEETAPGRAGDPRPGAVAPLPVGGAGLPALVEAPAIDAADPVVLAIAAGRMAVAAPSPVAPDDDRRPERHAGEAAAAGAEGGSAGGAPPAAVVPPPPAAPEEVPLAEPHAGGAAASGGAGAGSGPVADGARDAASPEDAGPATGGTGEDDAPGPADDGLSGEGDGPVVIALSRVSVLGFDDIALGGASEGPLSRLAPGYGGFAWIQAGIAVPGDFSGLGYAASSGRQIAFIGEKNGRSVDGYEGEPGSALGITRDTPFDLLGLSLCAATQDRLPVTITGTREDGSTVALTVEAPFVDAPGEALLRVVFDESWTGLVGIALDAPGYFGLDDLATRSAYPNGAFARSLTVLDFEAIDLGGQPDAPLSGLDPRYGGFAWTQAGIVVPDDYPGLGYRAASGRQVAFIGEKNGTAVAGYAGESGSPLLLARDAPFDLVGLALCAAVEDDLPVTFRGTRADGSTLSRTVAAPRADRPGEAPLAVAFDAGWRDLVALSIDAPGYFGIDDLAFTTGDRLLLSAAAQASLARGVQGGDTLVTWAGGSALLVGYTATVPGDIVLV